MRTDYYQQEYCRKILDREERRAKLRADYYSPEIVEISYKLKTLRSKLRSAKASNREALRDEILVLKDQLDERKQEEVSSMIALIRKGNVHIKVKIQNINNRNTYILLDRDSMIISQIIKYELKKSYTLLPANRNIIIEQLRGLLDNPMPKIIIRADVQHFFETIPQQPLLSKIKDDGFISRLTFKYLTKFFLCCNEANNNTSKVGVPRGLPFSSYLAELYMRPIDDEISQMKGVYYYKRYVDAVYEVFERDFIRHRAMFGSHGLRMKYHPEFQGRAYTFYHMTHKGEVESERLPDLRRCECMPWARPSVENVESWGLKFWRQSRQRSDNRVCICLERNDGVVDVDYFVILEVRSDYVLLWTAFVSEWEHQTKKKLREYEEWKLSAGQCIVTPDDLICSIQREIKARSGR